LPNLLDCLPVSLALAHRLIQRYDSPAWKLLS
jgi:hypothetical protein